MAPPGLDPEEGSQRSKLRLDTDSEVWGLDQTTWKLMLAGEAAMRKSISALRHAGYECIFDLPTIQQSSTEKVFVLLQ